MIFQARLRSAHLLGAIVCLGVTWSVRAQTPPQTSTPEGLQLLRRMQDALGGAERIASIRDYEETVQARTWNPDGSPLGQVRKRTRWLRSPSAVRLDQIGPRD